jgi:hypothetical protein
MTPDQKVYAAHNPDQTQPALPRVPPDPFFAPVEDLDPWEPVTPTADIIFLIVAVAIVAAEVGAIWFIYRLLHAKGLL